MDEVETREITTVEWQRKWRTIGIVVNEKINTIGIVVNEKINTSLKKKHLKIERVLVKQGEN